MPRMFRLRFTRFIRLNNVHPILRFCRARALSCLAKFSMDWCAKGRSPGFHGLIITHIGSRKAEKLLKVLSLMKMVSLAELRSIESLGDPDVSRRKFLALVHSTCIRHQLQKRFDEITNASIKNWAVTRNSSGTACPRGSFAAGARPLTLRWA